MYRYKKSSKRNYQIMSNLSLKMPRLRYKISSRCNQLYLWDLSRCWPAVRYKMTL